MLYHYVSPGDLNVDITMSPVLSALINFKSGARRYVGAIQSFSANNLTLVLYINNFKILEPFPHHAVEHDKSEWDSGTL
jgi:hypothetical protein